MTRTRLYAARTKEDGPAHATCRVGGTLDPVAVCGVRLSSKALTRPHKVFDPTDPHICKNCIKEQD